MIFKTEHAVALAIAVLLAYRLGKTASAKPPSADTNIQNPVQWWNYASSWAQ